MIYEKVKRVLIVCAILCNGILLTAATREANSPISLRVEYNYEILTVDKVSPLFSWEIPPSLKTQLAYQIEVYDVSGVPQRMIWQTTWVASNRTSTKYKGEKLKDYARYKWRVRIKDEGSNISDWSSFMRFGAGFVNKDFMPHSTFIAHHDENARTPIFQKSIDLDKSVLYASAYFACIGWANLKINGKDLLHYRLSPPASNYKIRSLYSGIDITEYLKKGANTVSFQLAEGYGAFSISDSSRYYNRRMAEGFQKPAINATVFIKLADGSEKIIGTDSTWRVGEGNQRYANIYGGEDIDLRQKYSELNERAVHADYRGKISPANIPPVVRKGAVSPAKFIKIAPTTIIYDFGENVVGWWKLKVKGSLGDTVSIRGTEKLLGTDFVGEIDSQSQLDLTERQAGGYYFRDKFTKFILSGTEKEMLEPNFFYHGYRYVQVDLSDENIQISEVEGIQAYHNYPIKGHFECSNPQLNQLYKNATSTLLGTVNQFPLSNPHSEMYPWTGDVSLFFTALDRMAKMESFWIKWLRDIKDSQKEDGSIPETVPNFRKISYGAEPAWAQDYVNLVLGLFYRTGDYSILENHFGSIKRLLDYYQSTYKEGSLPAYWGDHKQPTDGETVMKERGKTKELLDYISQAYYYKLLQDFVEICEILNRHKIKGKYIERAHEIKSEFNKHYWDVSKHNYTVRGLPPKNFDNTQTIHAIALQTGIVPDALIQSVYDLLIENIEAHHNKITTGIHGIRALFDVLISFGNKKRMHAIVMDAEYPGWMYQISQGATSLWQGFSGDVVCPPIIRTFYRPVIE